MLPIELVEFILDQLRSDIPTLLNCALVGRAWVYPSQRGIFHSIHLIFSSSGKSYYSSNTEMYTKRHLGLITLLDETPRLASYIRSLGLCPYPYHPKKIASKAFVVQTLISPSQEEAFLASITGVIDRLTKLERLSLESIHWGIFSPSMKKAITDLVIRTPSLTQVSLSSVGFSTFTELASLLSYMVNLKRLYVTLVRCSIPSNPVLDVKTTPRSIHLDELQFGDSCTLQTFMDWFQQDTCPFEVRNLRSLSLPTPFYMTILEYLGKNIRDLRFRRWGPLEQEPNPQNFRYVPNIRSLYLTLISLDLVDPPTWVQAVLENLCLNLDGDVVPLQCLTIRSSVLGTASVEGWDQWVVVDALLEKSYFSSLETVCFELRVRKSVLDGCDVEELLRKKLPYTEKSGRLKVNVRSYPQ